MKDCTEVATMGEYSVFQHQAAELSEVFTENLGNESIGIGDLERIKVPMGGSTQWTISDIEKGEQVVKTVEGIILYWRNTRAYYEQEYSGGNERPDCASDDGLNGAGEPGGVCAECACSQWGSARDGKGQACQQRKLLFVLQPDSLLPVVMSIPATSIRAIKSYLLRLTAKMVPYFAVTTKFELEKTKNEGGIVYSVVVPSLGIRLSEDQAVTVRALQLALKPALERVRDDGDDGGRGSGGGNGGRGNDGSGSMGYGDMGLDQALERSPF